MTDTDIRNARTMAEFFRARGMNPLPSRPDEKKPFVRFKHLWDAPADPDLFDRFPTSNVQVMTGRRWRLLVIDLDGPEAQAWWGRLPRRAPRTWATHSGGDGVHLWFRLPADYPRPLRWAQLWKGEGKHSGVDRLCDQSLIVAPPSIHPGTGNRYRFRSAAESPARLPMPADCPRWILEMPTLAREVPVMALPIARPAVRVEVPSGRYRPDEVRAAIPDIIALCREWGLRFPNPDAERLWVPCHAIGREDANPSAAVNRVTGSYDDRAGASLGFFDLAAAAGGLGSDWTEAVAILGERFGARRIVA